MLQFITTNLTAATLTAPYSGAVQATGGVEPYTYSILGGTLPPGLSFNSDGTLVGTATQVGTYTFIVLVVDNNGTQLESNFNFVVMDLIDLSDLTVDQTQFVSQFQDVLTKSGTWSVGLTTQTSQTLIELASAVGTFTTSRILRAKEDSFPETAQSDSAIRAIANMQGLRLSRKLPATVAIALTSPTDVTLSPYTQFTGSGYSFFNTDQIVLAAGQTNNVIVKEGIVQSYTISGLGTNLQAWVSTQDNFSVSDQDVLVSINNSNINKAFGGLWNYAGQPGYADLTLSDGRLLLQFGSANYGSVPGINDVITITYAITQGAVINGANTSGSLSVAGNPLIVGSFLSNPSGGGNEQSALSNKNFAAGSFGTYASGITKAQYSALVSNYPGIIDAVTQSQREINPAALAWMNVIRVSGLTNSPWSQTQIQEFLAYAQSVTMYSPAFIWQNPIPINVSVNLSIYCFNSVNSISSVVAKVEAAITNMFKPRPGILMTNFYISDLVNTAMAAAPGQISYVLVNEPTGPMLVTGPTSPIPIYTILPTGGTLSPSLYSYSISTDAPSPSGDGTTDIGSPSNWVYPQVLPNNTTNSITLDWTANAVPNATAYHVWGRSAGKIGIIATLPGTTTSYTDNGAVTPTVIPVTQYSDIAIRYNNLNSLTVNGYYAGRQTQATFPARDIIS